MKRVVPAILANDDSTLHKLITTAAATGASWVQVDIMDGVFVPSRSIGCAAFQGLSLPFNYEAHIMVSEPIDYIDCFARAGAKRIVFHYESTNSPLDVINTIKTKNMEAGLALNPETPTDAILPFVPKVASVLFLSVHPGYYGARYIPETLDKIKALRGLFPHLEIGIDGGIKDDNIRQAALAGADDLCVGSAIFLAPDPA